jgi:DNA-directed RNA polymerase specialized sigma24 family protein
VELRHAGQPSCIIIPSVQSSLAFSQSRCYRLADEESQLDEKFPDSASDQSENESHEKWVLTREALDKLLERFSRDREEAGRLYEEMRVKLLRFFEYGQSRSPDADVDETFTRVARRINEGENISNLNGYFYSVARLILKESKRHRDRTSVSLDDLPEPSVDPPSDDQKEVRLTCLDTCLNALTSDDRDLILTYYRENRRAKIDLRRQLADNRGITLDALRIRACRIRKRLEKDTRELLSDQL